MSVMHPYPRTLISHQFPFAREKDNDVRSNQLLQGPASFEPVALLHVLESSAVPEVRITSFCISVPLKHVVYSCIKLALEFSFNAYGIYPQPAHIRPVSADSVAESAKFQQYRVCSYEGIALLHGTFEPFVDTVSSRAVIFCWILKQFADGGGRCRLILVPPMQLCIEVNEAKCLGIL